MRIRNLIITLSAILISGFYVNAQKPEYLNEAKPLSKLCMILTKTNWKYLGKTPAIVDFYADWCGPCRYVAPFLEQLASEYGTKLKIYKVNTDNNPSVASAFQYQGNSCIFFIPAKVNPK
jgi:thiol-disulfide isomerase/thioredoxin